MMFGACGAHDIFVSSCEIIGGYAKTPVGERGITPGSNGRRPVHGCPNHTGVAARLSLRTPDGESHETVRSALWQRAATAPSTSSGGSRPCRQPWGHPPGSMRGRRSCPLPMSPGSAALTASEHRSSTRKQKRSANRLSARCGREYNRYGSICRERNLVGSGHRCHQPSTPATSAVPIRNINAATVWRTEPIVSFST